MFKVSSLWSKEIINVTKDYSALQLRRPCQPQLQLQGQALKSLWPTLLYYYYYYYSPVKHLLRSQLKST